MVRSFLWSEVYSGCMWGVGVGGVGVWGWGGGGGFCFQAEDGIRDLVRSRGLGDVYKRQVRISIEDTRMIGRANDERI